MRADIDALLPLIGGTQLHRRFSVIREMEEYTLLTPPFESGAVKELFSRAQTELGFRFPKDYYWFMKCCDGGLLFTNSVYSLLDPDETHNDLVERNRFLRDNDEIPEGAAAIGETNYGGYIVFCASGEEKMGIWDADEQTYVASFSNLYEWLDDVIQEARFLLENDGLPVIDDDAEADESER